MTTQSIRLTLNMLVCWTTPCSPFTVNLEMRIETQTGGLGVQVLDLVLSINSTLTLPFFSFDPARCSKYNPSSQSQAFL